MRIPLKAVMAIFVFCTIVFFVQSCGVNSPNTARKGTKGVNSNGNINTPTTTAGQVTPTTGSQTTGTGTVASTSGTGTGGAVQSSFNSGPGSSAVELPPSSGSGSGSNLTPTGDCVDDEDYVSTIDGLVHFTPGSESANDGTRCCSDSTGKFWLCGCYDGDKFQQPGDQNCEFPGAPGDVIAK